MDERIGASDQYTINRDEDESLLIRVAKAITMADNKFSLKQCEEGGRVEEIHTRGARRMCRVSEDHA